MLRRLKAFLGCGPDYTPSEQETAGCVNQRGKALKRVYSVAHGLLEKQLQDLDSLRNEFNSLHESDVLDSSDVAYSNSNKNRYVNVLPYDFNRVRIVGSSDDYINASLLQADGGELRRWCYIAAQGPLTHTTGDFWSMVYENCIPVIVMLTRTMENNHVKCAEYFPQHIGETSKYGRFRVTCVDVRQVCSDITFRQLQLKPGGCSVDQHKESLEVQHYHYHLWPDHGVPETVDPIRHLSKLLWPGEGKAPPDTTARVVHCSAGIGRTGAFIAIDIILGRLWQLASGETAATETSIKDAVDVAAVVHNLRRQRRGMVQTFEQYQFVYQAVLHELEEALKPDGAGGGVGSTGSER